MNDLRRELQSWVDGWLGKLVVIPNSEVTITLPKIATGYSFTIQNPHAFKMVVES